MSADAKTRTAVRRFRGSMWAVITVVVLVALILVLYWRGYEFYELSLDARVEHLDFRVLSPGEPVGHGYGIVGTALILTNLLYIVRRRFPRWPLGSVRLWLDMHVVTGLVGSVLVLFHSAFQLRTPIATVTAVSLLLVVVTGVIGRYLYALAPRFDEDRLTEGLQALDALIDGLGRDTRAALESWPITDLGGNASLFSTLRTLPTWGSEWRSRRRVVSNQVDRHLLTASLDTSERRLLKRVMRETRALVGQQVRAVMGSTLLRTWRGLHRLLAVLMILSVSVHIGVAWFYGYRWLWSE